VKAGTVIVDNSSAFRMDAGVPLVVPEINSEAIFTHKGIIANPNCSAIISITPLWPVHRKNRIKRMIISTYQAASGAGAARWKSCVNRRAPISTAQVRAQSAAASVCVQCVQPQHEDRPGHCAQRGRDEGHQRDAQDLRRSNIAIGITCVRIPVLRAHCVSVTFECEKPITPEEVREIMSKAPGVRVVDDQARNYFPMPVDASGTDEILVGRIRRDLSDSTGRSISIFSAGDQLLKGAALNAVQIAEKLLRNSRSMLTYRPHHGIAQGANLDVQRAQYSEGRKEEARVDPEGAQSDEARQEGRAQDRLAQIPVAGRKMLLHLRHSRHPWRSVTERSFRSRPPGSS
jgi:aspartate-semialdehyde dehydrogenase